MKNRTTAAAPLLAMLLLGASAPPLAPSSFPKVPYAGTLTVLTFNVKGVPWPIATGREEALRRVRIRLRTLRERGAAPRIVLLQEAFTPAALALAADAGYPYVARGPDARQSAGGAHRPDGGDWWHGETEGKFANSGLVIASDYPIVAVRQLAFSATACAGYDCLANKGVLIIQVMPPGTDQLVDILDTHLNSRRASGVNDDRSDHAYERQLEELERFVRAVHDPEVPLIAGGDFNMGRSPRRRAALALAASRMAADGTPLRDAMHDAASRGARLPPDAHLSMMRAKDLQLFSPGIEGLRPLRVDVPFGRERDGSMLSDHVGYVIEYRLAGRAGTAS